MMLGRKREKGICAWHSVASGSVLPGFAPSKRWHVKSIFIINVLCVKWTSPTCLSHKERKQSFLSYSERQWKWGETTEFAQKCSKNCWQGQKLKLAPMCTKPGLQTWVLKITSSSLVQSVLRQYSASSSEGKKQWTESETQIVFICTDNDWLNSSNELWQSTLVP